MRCSLAPTTALLAIVLSVGCVACTSSQPATSEPDNEGETVNTGYGTVDKSNSTAASSKVTPSESEQASANDLGDLLRGQTAGVRVTTQSGGIQIQIRGVNSIRADQSPLYILDGTPIEPRAGGTIMVHPREIESITIHKDASGTSIYGSRGSNGVVVIETKGGE